MNKKIEPKKETFSEMMKRFDCCLSMSTGSGWTNISFEKDFKDNVQMVVKFFDDEGRPLTDECGDGGVPIEEVTKVAEFIKALKELRLEEMTASTK